MLLNLDSNRTIDREFRLRKEKKEKEKTMIQGKEILTWLENMINLLQCSSFVSHITQPIINSYSIKIAILKCQAEHISLYPSATTHSM
jgi:hypothetical protein